MTGKRHKLLGDRELVHMRRAGLVVAAIHAALREAVAPGRTTAEMDEVSAAAIEAAGARSNFKGYHGFPATVCISVNEEIVHGIPGKRVLKEGDVVSFDCGAYVTDEIGRQWHSDACFTTIVGGLESGSVEDRALLMATEEARDAAIAAVARNAAKNAAHVGDVGDAVENVISRWMGKTGHEYGIPEEFTGHGIGNVLHDEPEILNYRTRSRGPRLRPGQVICIEPMLTIGSGENKTLADGWTAVTRDGSRAAHFEHTVAIMDGGVWVLTAPDGGEALLAPYGLKPVTLPTD
ncbi:type I methionyl aminopeptidase [Buchananella felis]